MKNNKNLIKIVEILIIVFVFVGNVYGASATPSLVTKLTSAFTKIQSYLVKLAVPIAGVAIASGVLIRKFSFGDEEKLRMGKKMIVNAIVGYGIILSIDLIIKFMDALI
ncbi:MAG: hypothetical protein IJ809_02260 [Clostridia bacterium]|nr:hypothetical protein [Clostridia bacterium]